MPTTNGCPCPTLLSLGHNPPTHAALTLSPICMVVFFRALVLFPFFFFFLFWAWFRASALSHLWATTYHSVAYSLMAGRFGWHRSGYLVY